MRSNYIQILVPQLSYLRKINNHSEIHGVFCDSSLLKHFIRIEVTRPILPVICPCCLACYVGRKIQTPIVETTIVVARQSPVEC